jgi:putative ubiquitin-RnfH superfamily antitoxin RatB of RatAB toxin-antitoxin module
VEVDPGRWERISNKGPKLLIGLIIVVVIAIVGFAYADLKNENRQLLADEQIRIDAYNRLVARAEEQDQQRIDAYNKLVSDYNELRTKAIENIDNYNQLVKEYNELASLRSVIEDVGTVALRSVIQSFIPLPLQ